MLTRHGRHGYSDDEPLPPLTGTMTQVSQQPHLTATSRYDQRFRYFWRHKNIREAILRGGLSEFDQKMEHNYEKQKVLD